MGNTVQQHHQNQDAIKNVNLQYIPKLLEQMKDSDSLEQILGIIKVIDPQYNFLASHADQSYEKFKIRFINMLPQAEFDYVMNNLRKYFSKEILNQLSNKKLVTWYKTNSSKNVFSSEFVFVRILLDKNLISEADLQPLLNKYLQEKNHAYSDMLETLELILMIHGSKLEIDITLITDSGIMKIVAKYLLNKTKMLQLECDTKEACIKEYESNKK
jgi:hypothetical protein